MDTIVITGANRGIGLELSKLFLSAGHKVVAGCRDPESASALRKLASSEQLTIFPLDVSSESSVSEFSRLCTEYKVDVLINNAGVLGGTKQSVDEVDYSAWLDTFRINTMAPLQLALEFRPMLRKSHNPRVVTISSQMGALSRKSKGSFAYRSSKAAVNKVMQVLALELDDIVCCPVHPGWVRTDMGGADADISVHESAKGIVALVTNMNLAMSGTFYSWDGTELDW